MYRFGEFQLDTARAQLLRDGEAIELRPQSFDVLRVLVENAGRLISKDELHDAVWGNVAVTDDSISHCISDIRRALDDKERILVRTVPRRGYILQAEVLHGGAAPDIAARGSNRRALLLVALGVLLAAGAWWVIDGGRGDDIGLREIPPNSIAVLPFVVTGAEDASGEQDYLGTAFGDQLRGQLGRVPGLRIAARSSSVAIVEQETDAVVMAQRLGVANIVEGSINLDGNQLGVSVRLLDGKTGLSRWHDTYERRRLEIVAVQQVVAEAIVTQLLPDADTAAATMATRNPSANEVMLLARHYDQEARKQPEVDVPKLLEAIKLYRQAVELDPESALAYSRLGAALLNLGDFTGAEAPIFRALTLNPELSEVQDTLGKYYWARGINGAAEAWSRAVRLNPNNADALASYAFLLWLQGDVSQPDRYYRRALELDPLSLARYWELGNFLGTQGRVDELRQLVEEVEQTFDDSAATFEFYARMHEFLGEADHAIAWSLRARDLDPDDPAHAWRLAELYAKIGDYDTARALEPNPGMGLLFFLREYEQLVETGEELMFDEPDDVMIRYLLAFGYNAIGDFDGAVRTLESAGFPGVMLGNPQAIEWEASTTYVSALAASGRMQDAIKFARIHAERPPLGHVDWWEDTLVACTVAAVGSTDEAAQDLVSVMDSPRLPWYPLIYDGWCFQGLADDPRYLDLKEHIEARRLALRQRLPVTLEQYGVEL